MRNGKPINETAEQLQQFRKKAEALINRNKSISDSQFVGLEMEQLLHELQVFQIELEMQNDELRKSYDHLQVERTKFSGLFDLAPVSYFILDKFGAITDINITGLNFMETTRSEIIGRRFQDFVAKDQVGEFYNMIRKMRAFNTRHNCQLNITSNKGMLYFAQLEGNGILNPLTADLQFYVAVIDITRRKEAEQRLVESNDRLKMTLEASGTGTWEIDLKAEKIYLDDNSYSILGLENWAFNGHYETFFKLLYPQDRDDFRNHLLRAINDEKELDTDFRILISHSGLRYITARGHVVHKDHNVIRFVGIIIDITEKKKLQQEAEEMRLNYQKSIVAAALQAQEKERERISHALHDSVAQMLYGIRLTIQNSDVDLSTEHLTNVNQLLNQAITEIRDISFELTPSILKDFGLIESVKEVARRLNTSNFNITVNAQGSKIRFKPDLEMSAFRIIQELINNSIKHGNCTEIHIQINLINACAMFVVSDNGSGFNLRNTEYLTTGSGLLSIKNRVSLFKGSFDIKSGKDKGTIVSVMLKDE